MDNNARETSMKILLDINKNKAYSNLSLNKYLTGKTERRNENLIREIVFGVLENIIYIDYILSQASKIKIEKIHDYVLEILRIGIYQIIFMDKIPDSAAVNESVKLAKKYGHKGTVGFTNGVLRSIAREPEKYSKINIKNKIKYISIKYSHPEELIKKWIDEFGFEFTEKLCQANISRPSLNIRVNTLKINRDNLIIRLSQKGFKPIEGQYSEDALIIKKPSGIIDTEEFKEGLFTVQDESSMLVAEIMDPEEGSKVIDICSAPGGKSTHIAQKMNNKGYILSRDIYPHKIKLLEENMEKLGINIIETQVYDALKKDKSLFEKFDYGLLDAPCSGLGLIRRKPEIKLIKKNKDILELASLQGKMIEIIKDYIKVGGHLIYSTCTIGSEENLDIINRFLKNNNNFKLVSIEDKIKNNKKFKNLKNGYIELYPHIHGTDGFFIAKMVKEG